MKYMLDFPGGFNYGFPRECKPADWTRAQEERWVFYDLLESYNVPSSKQEEAWLWARWYKNEH